MVVSEPQPDLTRSDRGGQIWGGEGSYQGASARTVTGVREFAQGWLGATATPLPPCQTAPYSPASRAPHESPPANRAGRSPASTVRGRRTATPGAALRWSPGTSRAAKAGG